MHAPWLNYIYLYDQARAAVNTTIAAATTPKMVVVAGGSSGTAGRITANKATATPPNFDKPGLFSRRVMPAAINSHPK